jgi:hypothetical protein
MCAPPFTKPQIPNQTLQQWVPAAKKFKIKEKLQDKFSSAEECFNTAHASYGLAEADAAFAWLGAASGCERRHAAQRVNLDVN